MVFVKFAVPLGIKNGEVLPVIEKVPLAIVTGYTIPAMTPTGRT